MVNKKRQTPEQVAAISDALVPAAEAPEWVLEPAGAADEFGLTLSSASPEKSRVWDRQEGFLAQYRECGKIGIAAKAVGLTRWAVDKWEQNDVYNFNQRIKAAHADYVESWEVKMHDRLDNPHGNIGSDPLFMFNMKAIAPEKYREDVKVIDQGAALQTWEMLKQLAMETHRQRQLESPAVEGDFKELDGGVAV